MRDDFDLFDPADDGGEVDPDLALITAWLARELSPMQVMAVEERLTTDVEFRAAAQPLIDAWAAPVASLGVGSHAATLSEAEKLESWRRFQDETSTGESTPPKYVRRISMKRVAAVIGVTVLPMVTFAQAVVYSAHNETAPGHAIAERIVALFSPAIPKSSGTTGLATTVADEPMSRPLVPAPATVQKAPAVLNLPTITAPAKPDRAKVVALAKEHQAAVVRGDTAVNYIVLVLDASGNYVWSTYGNGSVLFEVAGDPRTAAERDRDNREYRAELFGSATGTARGAGAGRLGALNTVVGRGRGRGGIGDSSSVFFIPRDSAFRLRHDTTKRLVVRRPVDSVRLKPRFAADSARPVFIDRMQGRGGFFGDSSGHSERRPYRNGFVSTEYGPDMNQAPGLQEPGNGQSGVQGLPSLSVLSSETYLFGAGELAPKALRVIVVNLIPGANWRR